ncbi:MAG: hypothetical protein Q9M35_04770 [Rhodothermus sp.]|nr:hypothetical protein [Rhodothermus sp.]
MRGNWRHIWTLIGSMLLVGGGYAQSTSCAFQTGQYATLLLPVEAFRELDIRPGDLLQAYTPEGQCAGQVRWNGDNTAMALWADDPMTPEKEGFAVGDSLRLVLWRPGRPPRLLQLFLATGQSYWVGVNRYVPDGIYRVRYLVPVR